QLFMFPVFSPHPVTSLSLSLSPPLSLSLSLPPSAVGVPPCDEPLFLRLCSPAHRRTVALAALASPSRSISPMRSKHQDTLLIGLSTGLFDTNNTKVSRAGQG